MPEVYSGNLSILRKRKSKIIAKRSELRKQLGFNLSLREYNAISKKIEELTKEVDKIETEILKVQKGMQNSNRWMDGTYNSFDLQF